MVTNVSQAAFLHVQRPTCFDNRHALWTCLDTVVDRHILRILMRRCCTDHLMRCIEVSQGRVLVMLMRVVAAVGHIKVDDVLKPI